MAANSLASQSLLSPALVTHRSSSSFSSTLIRPPSCKPHLCCSRLSTSLGKAGPWKPRSRAPFFFCSLDDNSETDSPPNDSNNGATIDLKLPRRSLLVRFTCDKCGERTSKLVNRLAYQRGLIYVQCAACLQYHKLVDNLGLVVEYDLREEINVEPDRDQAL